MIAIRGAIATVPNQAQDIGEASLKLIEQICVENSLEASDLITAQFSATSDLNAAYPAKGVRDGGYTNLAMMCYQEMAVTGSIGGCIRVVVLTEKVIHKVHHIYLGDAKALRPDWVGDRIGE